MKKSKVRLVHSLLFRTLFLVGVSISIISIITILIIYNIESNNVERDYIKNGYSLLDNLVEQTRFSISKGQRKSFQNALDNMANVSLVKETAMFTRNGYMTYLSGYKSIGKTFLKGKGSGEVINTNADLYQSTNGSFLRSDWHTKDLEDTEAAIKHAEQFRAQNTACNSCHFMLDVEKLNPEKTHVDQGAYFDFIYPIPIQKSCTTCHTQWVENGTAGYLKIAIDRSGVVKQKRGFLFDILLILAVVIIPSFILLFIIFRLALHQPLEKLIDFIKKVELEGDFSFKYDIKDQNEVGLIANSVNTFLELLQVAFLKLNQVVKALSMGDLTQKVDIPLKGNLNEFKDNINNSFTMLGHMVSQVTETSQRINHHSRDLAKMADDLSSGTALQASSTEQVSSSMEQISLQTRENSKNTADAKALINTMIEIVQQAKAQMETMKHSIKKITEASTNVSGINKTIDEIAFQTNILALNAAVEAARAGKFGRGFAVVAEEVRSLAGRSADAAKKATDLIEISLHEVSAGVKNTEKTAAILDSIIQYVGDTSTIITSIAEASADQNIKIAEINNGLAQISNIVQQNASIAGNNSTMSKDMFEEVSSLLNILNRFNIDNPATPGESAIQIEINPTRANS
ncbi:hypothetical protein KKI24_25060 [bacterium]|nr:hypothetical protein [bacterium]